VLPPAAELLSSKIWDEFSITVFFYVTDPTQQCVEWPISFFSGVSPKKSGRFALRR
jgi:hypothetical protein